MAVFDISEYSSLARDATGAIMPVGQEPAIKKQQVAIAAGSEQSLEFGPNSRLARFHSDVPCRWEVGPNPTATPASPRMAAGQTEYFGVRPGDRVAVISTT